MTTSGAGLRGFMYALQLADSFFPTGMYAHSHGLEGMVSRRWVQTASDVRELLRNQLAWALIPADGVALVNAHSVSSQGDLAALMEIDRMLHATKLAPELRGASRQAGRRILQETQAILSESTVDTSESQRAHSGSGLASTDFYARYWEQVDGGETPGTGAVALGATASVLGIPKESALLMFCHSHAVSVLGAAMRLLPITHSQAQQVLHSLHDTIIDLGTEAMQRPWQEMAAFTPALDLASMLHETDDLRLFAS